MLTRIYKTRTSSIWKTGWNVQWRILTFRFNPTPVYCRSSWKRQCGSGLVFWDICRSYFLCRDGLWIWHYPVLWKIQILPLDRLMLNLLVFGICHENDTGFGISAGGMEDCRKHSTGMTETSSGLYSDVFSFSSHVKYRCLDFQL